MNVMTTLQSPSLETASKYHQSKTEPLMGETLGPSRPVALEVNWTRLGPDAVVAGMAVTTP